MSNLERYNKVFCEVMQVSEDDLPTLKFKESKFWDSVGHMTLLAAIEGMRFAHRQKASRPSVR